MSRGNSKGAAEGEPFSMIEYRVPGHFAGPPVTDSESGEHLYFYVLDGELIFQLDGAERHAPAGSLIQRQPDQALTWSNPSAEPARLLALWSPHDSEDADERLREVVAKLEQLDPPSPRALAEILAQAWYGSRTFAADGPDEAE